ncbi:uncharacterized protein LOC135116954 [Helicoverpa armigera]|uniref:uncharacterized protein LOC135116954 n=1 Tax=Helicoverpa armigera TaxID=29058 RepID=UPI003083125E
MANRVPSEGHRRGTWGPRKPSLGGRSGGEGHADGASEGWKSGLSAPDSSLIECPMSHCKPASRSYIYRVVLACLPSVGRSQLRAPWRGGVSESRRHSYDLREHRAFCPVGNATKVQAWREPCRRPNVKAGGRDQVRVKPVPTQAPVTVPSAAHPLGGPHITQHTEQIAPHAGTSGPSASVNADTVTRTEDYFSSAWQVQKRKGKGKQTPQPQRPNQNQHGVSSKKRKINPRQRRRARMNANAAPDTPALPAAPTSGQPCFCAGGRTQAQAGESRPGPSGRPPGAGAGRPVKEGDETISPAGEVQTAAKRALNETLSPRGKRKRQCLDPSKRATPRVSYAQATKKSLCIAVTCGHTGILTKDVADTILTGIQKTILKEAWSPNNKQPGPAFNGKPVYTEGVLKLWCSNDHTLTWLQKTIADLALSTGHQLIIKSQSEITRRIRCGILIPNEQGAITDSRDIGRILAYQNPQIAVDRWVLKDRRSSKAPALWWWESRRNKSRP